MFRWRERAGRPPVHLDVMRVHHAAWDVFAAHHYLATPLNRSASCYVAEVEGTPVAFVAIRYQPMGRQCWLFHRLVTLPEWQGLGLALRLVDHVAREYQDREPHSVRIMSRHPGLVRGFARSPLWRCTRAMGPSSRRALHRSGARSALAARSMAAGARGEITATFEFVGP